MPDPLGTSAGAAVASLLPRIPSWGSVLGRAIPSVGAFMGGRWLGSSIMKRVRPDDYLYNPTPENMAKYYGIATTTPLTKKILKRAGVTPGMSLEEQQEQTQGYIATQQAQMKVGKKEKASAQEAEERATTLPG